MKLLAIEAVCLIEKVFPTSIMDIQLHLIVHLADEVAYAGTLYGKGKHRQPGRQYLQRQSGEYRAGYTGGFYRLRNRIKRVSARK